MFSPRNARRLVASGLVLFLAACTHPAPSESVTSSAPSASYPAQTPTTSPPAPSIEATTGASTAREGVDYEVLFDMPSTATDTSYDTVLAALPGGSVLIARGPHAVPPAAHQMIIKNKDSERVLPALSSGKNRYAIAGASADKTVAWVESPNNSGVLSDWELFGIDKNGTSRHLASASDFAKQFGAGGNTTGDVAVDDTHAYLVVGTSDGERTSIVSAPLDGGTAAVLADNATFPAAGTQGLYFVRQSEATGTKKAAAALWLAPRDTDGTRLVHTASLAENEWIDAQCALGDKVLWATVNQSDGVQDRISILSPNGTVARVPFPRMTPDHSLTCSGDLAAWGGSSPAGQYVYSLSTNTVWKVGQNASTNAVWVSDKTIVLATPASTAGHTTGFRVVRWLR